jgi:GPH family glycoside/pentoside/hexuronide:cation symporter
VNQPAHTAPLRRGLLLAFSLPAIMQGFMHAPEYMVQGIYAKYAGLPLAAMAGALLAIRVFDGITYPLIGFLSDYTFRRSGTRKPWVLAGTVLTALGLWFLYRPPAGVGVLYFGAWMMTAYFGWKLTEIPYSAWSFELSGDYTQRSRIQTWRAIGMLAGSFVFYIVPYAAKALRLTDSTELNLQSLGLTAIVVALLMPLLNLYSLLRVPDGEIAPVAAGRQPRESLGNLLRAVFRNGPLMVLLAAFVPITAFGGMSSGVVYLYFDAYMKLGDKLPAVMLTALLATLLGLPFWGWACTRFNRHRVWALSSATGAAAYTGMLLAPTGPAGLLPLLLLFPLGTLCALSAAIAVPSLLGDSADYGRWKFGEERAGVYSALYAFLVKSLGGVSAAAGLAVIGWFGFDATTAKQTASGAFGMKLVAIGLPALGLALGAAIAWFFPIDRKRQARIRAELQARDAAGAKAGS